ncbi:hypothetical protein Pelo_15124 [Pelomyxa schiedti]|nr:hypothetical protein Pelo_15124 [Pelomyxa schiedti]
MSCVEAPTITEVARGWGVIVTLKNLLQSRHGAYSCKCEQGSCNCDHNCANKVPCELHVVDICEEALRKVSASTVQYWPPHPSFMYNMPEKRMSVVQLVMDCSTAVACEAVSAMPLEHEESTQVTPQPCDIPPPPPPTPPKSPLKSLMGNDIGSTTWRIREIHFPECKLGIPRVENLIGEAATTVCPIGRHVSCKCCAIVTHLTDFSSVVMQPSSFDCIIAMHSLLYLFNPKAYGATILSTTSSHNCEMPKSARRSYCAALARALKPTGGALAISSETYYMLTDVEHLGEIGVSKPPLASSHQVSLWEGHWPPGEWVLLREPHSSSVWETYVFCRHPA